MNSIITPELTEKLNFLTGKIIQASIEIHRTLGSGLLESAYEACLIYELRLYPRNMKKRLLKVRENPRGFDAAQKCIFQRRLV